MPKQAKLQLVADVKDFKQSVKEAREMLQGLSDVNIDNKGLKKISENLEQDLADASKKIEQEMRGILAVMTKLGQEDVVDSQKVKEQTKRLTELKNELREIKNYQQEISQQSQADVPAPTRGGMGAGGMIQQGLGRGMGALGLGVGVAGALSVARGDAEEKLRLRALTGGRGVPQELEDFGIQYGFSDDEMRKKQEQLARALARDVTGDEMKQALTPMLQAERAYGVETQTSTQTMTAARKAGVQDQAKYLGDTIGMAVTAGLEGSRISEFLEASNAYLEQMSQGINIDSQSLNGFAGALSTIPFFAQDPNRAFNMLRSMNQMFQSGDPYQRTLAARGIIQGAGGRPESLGAVEFRRQMGLFGEIDEDTRERLGRTEAGKNLLGTLDVSGADIIQNIFKDVQNQTRGMDMGNRLFAFQQATGMDAGAAASMFARLETGEGITKEDIETFKKAQMTPEERLEKTFSGVEKEIRQFTSQLANVIEQMSVNIAGPMSKLGNQIPLNTEQLAKVAQGLIALNLLLGAKGAIDILKGGKDILKGGKAKDILTKGKDILTKGKTGDIIKGAGGLLKRGAGTVLRGAGTVASRLAGPAAVAYSLLPTDTGPEEGSLEAKLERGERLTPEEMRTLYSGNERGSKAPTDTQTGFNLLKRPDENLMLPPAPVQNSMLPPIEEMLTPRSNYVERPMETGLNLSDERKPEVDDNTEAIKNLTTANKNLTTAIEKASGGGGFIDKTKSPIMSGVKVGVV